MVAAVAGVERTAERGFVGVQRLARFGAAIEEFMASLAETARAQP